MFTTRRKFIQSLGLSSSIMLGVHASLADERSLPNLLSKNKVSPNDVIRIGLIGS